MPTTTSISTSRCDYASEHDSYARHGGVRMLSGAADDQDIGHFVNETIQTLPGVKDTFTLIAFKAFI
jgi:hypothetical protein